jgi:hypothetical protein
MLLSVASASAQTQAASGAGASDGLSSMTGINLGDDQVDEATLEKRREIEKAYKDAIRSNPPQQAAKNDPWANMRGPDEQKPAKLKAKTAQKKKPAQ